jgi:hypothetical protein
MAGALSARHVAVNVRAAIADKRALSLGIFRDFMIDLLVVKDVV